MTAADEGISGTKIKNRKEFQRLLRDARDGLFQMVVVKDISRFARNTVDFLQSIRTLKALGIETAFLTANMTVLGNSEFVLTIFGALAQEESANTSKRVKFGKKLNAEKGRVPNLVYGYDKIAGDYFNLKINAREAAVIRRIYTWYLGEGYGAASIAAMLNAQGCRTKRGCLWSQNGICRILSNELYIGKIINGKQEVADFLTGTRVNREEAEWIVINRPDLRIVDPAQWERARQIMHRRSAAFQSDKQRQSNKHLFSTLIRCKECGYSFRRTVRTYRNTYVRWVCSGHNGHGAASCPNAVSVGEEELIAALDTYLIGLLRAGKHGIDTVIREWVRMNRDRKGGEAQRKELRKRLSGLQNTRRKYMDMYADDLISRTELNETVGGMREEIERMERDLQALERGSGSGDRLEQSIRGTFPRLEDFVSVRNWTNSQLKQLIQSIEVDQDGNVDVYFRQLGAAASGDSVPVCPVCT